MIRTIQLLITVAFIGNAYGFGVVAPAAKTTSSWALKMSDDDVLNRAIEMMSGGGQDAFETPDMTQARIDALVNQHKVLLFMKGNKSFPQCGFSDTATKILDSLGAEFHDVDVLADQAIREGVKIYSQWPTIPQLYIDGEFIGGTDIMLEMFEKGELKELLQKVCK